MELGGFGFDERHAAMSREKAASFYHDLMKKTVFKKRNGEIRAGSERGSLAKLVDALDGVTPQDLFEASVRNAVARQLAAKGVGKPAWSTY